MNKESILKQYALDQWLSSYKTDNPAYLYDLITTKKFLDCSDDAYTDLADTYELEPWELIESHEWEYIVQQIENTYYSIKNLLETLGE